MRKVIREGPLERGAVSTYRTEMKEQSRHISKEHSRKRRQVCVRAKGARANPDGDEERATKKKAGRGEEHELTQSQGLASHGRHLRALGEGGH